jgi:hypothetical protein
MEQRWSDTEREKPERRETCPNAALATKNLTWTKKNMNLGLRGEKPATNRLRYGTTVNSLLL